MSYRCLDPLDLGVELQVGHVADKVACCFAFLSVHLHFARIIVGHTAQQQQGLTPPEYKPERIAVGVGL